MNQKEILTAPKVSESLLYGVDCKPLTGGAVIFVSMKYNRLRMVWNDMKRRCDNPKREAYKNYGGRGISVCAEWYDYGVFKDWALKSGYSETLLLDRSDNNGNYEPCNCRFVTRSVSTINQRKRKNYNIYYKNGTYRVRVNRNMHKYSGGSTKDINKARILRDNLIAKLDSIIIV